MQAALQAAALDLDFSTDDEEENAEPTFQFTSQNVPHPMIFR